MIYEVFKEELLKMGYNYIYKDYSFVEADQVPDEEASAVIYLDGENITSREMGKNAIQNRQYVVINIIAGKDELDSSKHMENLIRLTNTVFKELPFRSVIDGVKTSIWNISNPAITHKGLTGKDQNVYETRMLVIWEDNYG